MAHALSADRTARLFKGAVLVVLTPHGKMCPCQRRRGHTRSVCFCRAHDDDVGTIAPPMPHRLWSCCTSWRIKLAALLGCVLRVHVHLLAEQARPHALAYFQNNFHTTSAFFLFLSRGLGSPISVLGGENPGVHQGSRAPCPPALRGALPQDVRGERSGLVWPVLSRRVAVPERPNAAENPHLGHGPYSSTGRD